MQLAKKKLFYLLFLFFTVCINGQQSPFSFESISVDKGLSQGIVTSIAEDSRGFLWVGTRNGLNRLIGTDITVFHHHDGLSSTIPSDQIRCLETGPRGRIWIGTDDGGIASLEPGTETVKRYSFITADGKDVSDSQINGIAFASDTVLWAAAGSSGLFNIDLRSDKTEVVDLGQETGLTELIVSDIFIRDGMIWVATAERGLLKYEPGRSVLNHYYDPEPDDNRHYNEISKILPAEYPWIWVATQNSFLQKVNSETGENIVYDSYENPILHHASIYDLLPEGKDSLWLATTVGGLQLFHIPEERIELVSNDQTPMGIAYNSVNVVYRASNDILWVGTNGKGLSFYHPGTNRFTGYSKERESEYKLDFESVRSVYADSNWIFFGGYYGINRINRRTHETVHWLKGKVGYTFCETEGNKDQLLVGTEGDGIKLIDKKHGVKDINIEGKGFIADSEIDPLSFVYAITHYKESLYLLGNTGGMAVLDLSAKEIIKNYEYSSDPASIVRGEIKTILVDSEDRVWVGSTSGGLARFFPEEERFLVINTENGYNELPGTAILDMLEDSEGLLWLGTGKGLCLLDPDKGLQRTYTVWDGLSNNFICSIEECRHGYLWCGSNEGISRLDKQTGVVINYNDLHGLPGKEMNRGASFVGKDGTVYFGGVDGSISFSSDPEEFDLPEPYPQVTGYFEYNQPVSLDTMLPYTNKVTVPAGTRFFSFEISGNDFMLDKQNMFRYTIPGLVSEWIDLGYNRRISLTNVDPGTYLLSLSVSNDGVKWVSNESAMKIKVEPLFVQTPIARILGLIILIIIIFAIIYFRTRYLTRQKAFLNRQIEQRTKELSESESQLREAVATKDRFFSILAHDLRSPFSSLLGLSEIITEEWDDYSDEDKLELLGVLRESILHTYKLLNNLLDWSRLQRGVIKPDLRAFDLSGLISDVLKALEVQASSKNTIVENNISGSLMVYADEQMTETVIRNLLSNAVKFTPPGGKVSVSTSKEDAYTRIAIKDTGVGMDAKTRESLYDLAEIKSTPGTDGEKGTGLGLLVSREFIQLMNGDFGFSSEPGKGSEFWFLLPDAMS